MEFQSVVAKRRMVRSFEDRLIPEAALERILTNARRGPSAGFSQGFEFLVLTGPEETARYWDALDPERGWARRGWPGVYHAPVLIVPLAHRDSYVTRYQQPDKAYAGRHTEADWMTPYWLVDTSFAGLLILLTAVDLGLGALFFGVRDRATLHAAFAIPDSYEPIGTIAIGYPAPDRPSSSLKRGRRPADSVIHRGRW